MGSVQQYVNWESTAVLTFYWPDLHPSISFSLVTSVLFCVLILTEIILLRVHYYKSF